MTDADLLKETVLAGGDPETLGFDGERLSAAARSVCDGPEAADVFFWLCRWQTFPPAITAAAEFLGSTQDPATLADILDGLNPTGMTDGPRRELWHAFINRADDRSSGYGVRSQALHGALLLSQDRPSLLFRLKGALVDIDLDDNPMFLRHAARVIGTVLAHGAEGAEFRNKLVAMFEIDEAADEAALELGLYELRNGLQSTTSETAEAAFAKSVEWFTKSSSAGEGRVDADLFGLCADLLVSVHRGGFDGDLEARLPDLVNAAFLYSAYLGDEPYSSTPSWLGSRNGERIHWTALGAKLALLDATMGKRVWLDVVRVVEDELLAVYRASRSIMLFDREGGIDLLVRPAISGALHHRRRHLDELDQWIEENEGSENLPDALAMREAVDRAREANLLHRPSAAASENRELVAIFETGGVPESLVISLAGRQLEAAEHLSVDESPFLASIAARILSDIERNRHFVAQQSARSLFILILIQSLNFVAFRHETGRASDRDGGYLFVRKPETLPVEADLQHDYFRFLKNSPVRQHVSQEVRDVGSGRADVYFSARGVTTVTEVKRSLAERNLQGLVDDYGLQTVAYQTTNVSFAFLLVLDLFDRSKGAQPHIEEQVALLSKTPSGQATVYDVVVMRVQAQRKVPSAFS